MKRITVLFLAVLMLFSFVSCSPVDIEYGESELYTDEEIDMLAEIVKDKFAESENGYVLYNIRYLGDELCETELIRLRKQDGKEYEACMVLQTSCRILIDDMFYDAGEYERFWSYWFLKEPNGEWFLCGYGY